MTIPAEIKRYVKMTDEEFGRECLRRCSPELVEKFKSELGEADDQNLVEQVFGTTAGTREFLAAMPKDLKGMIQQRAKAMEILAALTAVMPIAKVFDNLPVPARFAELKLPYCAPISGDHPIDRKYRAWRCLTWPELEVVRGILARDNAWGTLDAALQIFRGVESVMREHPERNLGEAFALLAADTAAN